MIEIHLYGDLRRYIGQEDPRQDAVALVHARSELTVAEALQELGVPLDEARHIFINGLYDPEGLGRKLRDGDRIGVFPRNMTMPHIRLFAPRAKRESLA
ncbi:MoaD/ThiS family protein [Thermoflexus sp.]|uniref:MoaD/ThiS family protein n=1 Tax=Thermoflexus sp. TaxID=1969742 RepID=UPI0025D03F18|nr:MoaD/ThiS family protein [Thermoflexus sp.]MDW8180239.1 MoaD/ThiS family protein [Anaerolineae bacterium]MCS6962653.1 MoaD/ThiS family protein [Thermoflexus sp.]MCS7350788.1 MoaD/ThiS family protein [Thermoflexus sp.]MCX7689872.1 MoaD/ThiS family protein [Thermoflexus sp.]MDW8183806.1 MoaD/ThiS family protein [Anaerolineae bacterium]